MIHVWTGVVDRNMAQWTPLPFRASAAQRREPVTVATSSRHMLYFMMVNRAVCVSRAARGVFRNSTCKVASREFNRNATGVCGRLAPRVYRAGAAPEPARLRRIRKRETR